MSGVIAASFGVQYYVIPTIFSSTLGENKGLGSAYIDGFAYFCSGFVWKAMGNVVKTSGWFSVWIIVSVMCLIGGGGLVYFLWLFFNEKDDEIYIPVEDDEGENDNRFSIP